MDRHAKYTSDFVKHACSPALLHACTPAPLHACTPTARYPDAPTWQADVCGTGTSDFGNDAATWSKICQHMTTHLATCGNTCAFEATYCKTYRQMWPFCENHGVRQVTDEPVPNKVRLLKWRLARFEVKVHSPRPWWSPRSFGFCTFLVEVCGELRRLTETVSFPCKISKTSSHLSNTTCITHALRFLQKWQIKHIQ